jgi:hypothetical protein
MDDGSINLSVKADKMTMEECAPDWRLRLYGALASTFGVHLGRARFAAVKDLARDFRGPMTPRGCTIRTSWSGHKRQAAHHFPHILDPNLR